MSEHICIKTNSTYENPSNREPFDLCFYHYLRRDKYNANSEVLQNYLDRNTVCKNSINHVKELIKRL